MKVSNVLSSLGLEYAIRGDIDYNENISLADLDLEIINTELTDEEFHAAAIQALKKIKIAEYSQALKMKFADVANEKDYDSEMSVMSYLDSTNEIWKAQAIAYNAWRDDCWGYVYDLFSAIEMGEIEAPTIEDFINNLPTISW